MEYRCVAKNSLGGSDGTITLYGKLIAATNQFMRIHYTQNTSHLAENKYNHSISEVQPPTTSTTTTTTETFPTTTTTRLHHRVTLGADRKGTVRVIILALLYNTWKAL